eukprot:TRINITY_DN2862_c0_g1_i3.p1 TRINITY_DN2862_c0_g1~~TRINITY_DN2862_c0_g1_i3.p1  ORF type:complete len:129 (+),score=31.39 TRINITY_DN2862_c0_g1_i3:329-715(+)
MRREYRMLARSRCLLELSDLRFQQAIQQQHNMAIQRLVQITTWVDGELAEVEGKPPTESEVIQIDMQVNMQAEDPEPAGTSKHCIPGKICDGGLSDVWSLVVGQDKIERWAGLSGAVVRRVARILRNL